MSANILKNLDIQQLKREVSNLPKDFVLKLLLEKVLENAMQQERKEFLSSPLSSPTNKANGYYNRTLHWHTTQLNVKVPRDRESNFRSAFLPPSYSREYEAEYDKIIQALILNGYSKAKLYECLKKLNLPYSKESVERIIDKIHQTAKSFKNRELPEKAVALYIDGYHTYLKKKDKVVKAVVYVAMGIDFELKKDIYGWWVMEGGESAEKWKEVFSELIRRGLKKVSIIITDNLSGIKEVVDSYYSGANHQLCLVHLQRALKRYMKKGDAQKLNSRIKEIRKEGIKYEEAKEKMERELEKWEDKYPIIKEIKRDLERYIAFFKYPEKARKFFYSTNALENFNSVIERQVKSMAGFFPSERYLDVNIYLARERVVKRRWRKGIPALKEVIYELTQIYNMQYL